MFCTVSQGVSSILFELVGFFLWGFGKQLSSISSPPTLPFILKENGAADNEMGEPNIIRERAGGLCPS